MQFNQLTRAIRNKSGHGSSLDLLLRPTDIGRILLQMNHATTHHQNGYPWKAEASRKRQMAGQPSKIGTNFYGTSLTNGRSTGWT